MSEHASERRELAVHELVTAFAHAVPGEDSLRDVLGAIARWTRCRCVGLLFFAAEAGEPPLDARRGFDDAIWSKLRARETNLSTYRDRCAGHGLASAALIRLPHRGVMHGALYLADEEPGKIGPHDRGLIEDVAPILGELLKRLAAERALGWARERERGLGALRELSLGDEDIEGLLRAASETIVGQTWIPPIQGGSIHVESARDGRRMGRAIVAEGCNPAGCGRCERVVAPEVASVRPTERVRATCQATGLIYELPLAQNEVVRGGVRLCVDAHERSADLERFLSTVGRIVASGVQRRVAEQARRRSDQEIHEIIQRAPMPMVIHREARILYANTAFARLVRYEPEELAGVPLVSVSEPSEAGDIAEHLERAYAGRGVPHDRVLVRKDGERVAVEIAGMAQVELGGSPAIVACVLDVTERRRADAKLMHANRMASLGALAAGIAHEMNNPLAYVTSNVSLASELVRTATPALPAETAKTLEEALADAAEGTARVTTIVRGLREFARVEAPRTVPFDPRRALEFAVRVASAEIRRCARLVREDGPVPTVLGDETRLGQVFLNLLVNAAQAIPDGAPHLHRIVVRSSAHDGRVTFAISDTGVGIPRENLPRIFDPFFTTKPAGSGTGLGLAICLGIIEEMGGTIEAESEAGHGTTFRVVLPMSAAHQDPSRPGGPPSVSLSS